MANQLFLCYYGDGPYWSDTISLPALPSGVSYIHEFRYDQRLVQHTAEGFGSIGQVNKGKLVDAQVCLAAHFQSARHRSTFLPIRKAIITKATASANISPVLFRLGPLSSFDVGSVASKAIS